MPRMRKLFDHKGSVLNNATEIGVLDEPGLGGASTRYSIDLMRPPGDADPPLMGDKTRWILDFQNGPVKQVGLNGISDESLIAIVLDRLRGFQAGPFGCRDNALAITHLEDALARLQRRTRDRQERGVEGTDKP